MSPSSAVPAEPHASRPRMPQYGLLPADEGRGLLPWSWARERLERSHNYWLSTTRPDGRPHAAAVWGIWWQDAFFFSTARGSRKARNLARNAACVVCTESAAEAVIVEGSARPVVEPEALRQIAPLYQTKYGQDYPEDSALFVVQPIVVFGFIEAGAEFAGSATRWRFAPTRR